MMGFFEHQYLSYKKNIKNCSHWQSPTGICTQEEALLYKIGARYGLKERQVKQLISSEEKHEFNIPDNHNDRMNLLYDLILMVYADDVVDPHEIEFCEAAVHSFGMKKELVQWLLKEFDRGTPPPPDEWEEMKLEARENFLRQ